METLRRNIREFDFTMVAVLILLAVYSCLAIAAAVYGKSSPSIPHHAWLKQFAFEMVGMVTLVLVAAFDYRTLRKFRWWLYGGNILLLLAVFGMHSAYGAHSWIRLGGVLNFQPSELAKLTMIVLIANYMATNDENEFPDYNLKRSLPIWGMFALPFALVLVEPALGQALVMFAIVMTMYIVYAKKSHFAFLLTTTLVIVAILIVVVSQFAKPTATALENVQGTLAKHHLVHAFQTNRILTWLDPSYDPMGSGWDIHHGEIAIGSGQIFGEGLFKGRATQGGWVHNQWNDYIFTAIGEEFGFVGSSVLILLFILLSHRLMRIAGNAQDTFGTYLVIGILGMFVFQVFENIGMDMYVSPSTGITLPFVSYGGTSLLANYLAVGLALSVGLRRKKLRFS